MTWGVCLEYDARENFRRAWGYLIQESEIPNAWERNTHPQAEYATWKGWHFNASMDDIPDPLIVLTPQDGSKLQGEQSLYDFVHPENAVYYFGGDRSDLRHSALQGRPYTSVYIPDSGFMHSFTAAAMVVYDRKLKSHGNH